MLFVLPSNSIFGDQKKHVFTFKTLIPTRKHNFLSQKKVFKMLSVSPSNPNFGDQKNHIFTFKTLIPTRKHNFLPQKKCSKCCPFHLVIPFSGIPHFINIMDLPLVSANRQETNTFGKSEKTLDRRSQILRPPRTQNLRISNP